MSPLIAIPLWRAPTWERSRDYFDSVRAAGGELQWVEGGWLPPDVRGLVLAGGVDIDPAIYGEKPHPETGRPHRERDEQELTFLREAMQRDVPVLAVCRGHQLLNAALGGTLLQHIDGDGHRCLPTGESRWHDVMVQAGTLLSGVPLILSPSKDAGPAVRVNSRHHQAVTPERLAPGLRAAALSPDGLVEAVESTAHRWVLGLQWHPERREMRPGSAALFAAFVRACAKG